jgi:hypothetical protein
MIYYSTTNACIMSIDKYSTAFLVLEGYVNETTIKEFGQKAHELCIKSEVSNVIFDTSRLEILKKEEIAVLSDKLIPLFQHSHINKIAYLKPQNAFGELSMNLLMNIKTINKIRKFNSLEEAEKWVYDKKSLLLHA